MLCNARGASTTHSLGDDRGPQLFVSEDAAGAGLRSAFSEPSHQLARAFMRVQTLCCVRGSLQLGGIAPLFDPTLVKPHTRRIWQLSLSRPRTSITRILQFLDVASFLSVCRFGTYHQYLEDMCDNCPSTIVGVFFFQSQLSVITFVIFSLSVFATFFCCLHVILRVIHRVVLADVVLFEVYVRHVCGAFRELCLPLTVSFSQNFLFQCDASQFP